MLSCEQKMICTTLSFIRWSSANTKHKAQSTKHKAQSTKHKAQSTKHKAHKHTHTRRHSRNCPSHWYPPKPSRSPSSPDPS
ncbi:hypothetical protein ACHAXS_009972 [Conticribra weissflogii]